MSPPVRPGLALTLYDGSASLRAAWLGSKALLFEARPPIVQLHCTPGAAAEPTLDAMRRELVGVRTWVGVPGNPLVRDDGPEKAAKLARTCRGWGVELFVLNLEKSGTKDGKPFGPGWTPDSGTAFSPEQLERRARALLDAVRAELGPTMKLGLTSHDKPRRFRLPWNVLLGAGSPVAVHLPQYYPAPARKKVEPEGPPAPTTWRGAKTRGDASDADWLALARAGTIRADLAPGGEGFAVYTQVHDITPGGVAHMFDRSALACAWALNGQTGEPDRRKRPKCDAAGARGIRITQAVRRETGEAPGAIARWQLAHGLEGDGVFGEKSEAVLTL